MKPAQHGFELNYIIDGTQTVFIEPLHLGKGASFGARSNVDKEIAHWTLDPVDPCKGWKTTLGENTRSPETSCVFGREGGHTGVKGIDAEHIQYV